MPPHSGPVLALMALLALAGVYKISDPSPTSGALRAAGLPSSRRLVLGLGGLELITGLAGVFIGGPIPPLAAAAMYLSFALFVGNALWNRLPISSCGCLGARETPPSPVHVVVNLMGAAMLLVAFLSPVDFIGGLADLGLARGTAFTLFTIALVYLLYGALAVLPLRSAVFDPATSPPLSRPGDRGR